jgi:integrase/recombinase XerC
LRTILLISQTRDIILNLARNNGDAFDFLKRAQQNLIRRAVSQVKKISGVKFYFHLLRHYFASALVDRGADFITVAEILGHSKTVVSLGYAHTSKERKQKAVDLLN